MAGIVVQLSFLSRPVCLPVLARLWQPRHIGKIAHARQLAELIAAAIPTGRCTWSATPPTSENAYAMSTPGSAGPVG